MTCFIWIFIIGALIIASVALAYATTDKTWHFDNRTHNLITNSGSYNVEIGKKSSLIIHNDVFLGATGTVLSQDISCESLNSTTAECGTFFYYGNPNVLSNVMVSGQSFEISVNEYESDIIGLNHTIFKADMNTTIIASKHFVTIGGSYTIEDSSIKENITTLDPYRAMGRIMNLNPVIYQYIDSFVESNSELADTTITGFIAEEYKIILPQSVKSIELNIINDTTLDYYIMKYDELIATIVSGMQFTSRKQIELYATQACMQGSPTSTTTTIPSWFNSYVCSCLSIADPATRVTCLCSGTSSVCNGVNGNINFCANRNIYAESCSVYFG